MNIRVKKIYASTAIRSVEIPAEEEAKKSQRLKQIVELFSTFIFILEVCSMSFF